MLQQGLKTFIGKGHKGLPCAELYMLVFLWDKLEAIKEMLECLEQLAEEVMVVVFLLEGGDDVADTKGW